MGTAVPSALNERNRQSDPSQWFDKIDNNQRRDETHDGFPPRFYSSQKVTSLSEEKRFASCPLAMAMVE
jgi:hypothetical protein